MSQRRPECQVVVPGEKHGGRCAPDHVPANPGPGSPDQVDTEHDDAEPRRVVDGHRRAGLLAGSAEAACIEVFTVDNEQRREQEERGEHMAEQHGRQRQHHRPEEERQGGCRPPIPPAATRLAVHQDDENRGRHGRHPEGEPPDPEVLLDPAHGRRLASDCPVHGIERYGQHRLQRRLVGVRASVADRTVDAEDRGLEGGITIEVHRSLVPDRGGEGVPRSLLGAVVVHERSHDRDHQGGKQQLNAPVSNP